MKSVTVGDLRSAFAKVERMLRVTKRSIVIATLKPENEVERPPMPDFEARLREIYGDKVFEVSGADLISEDREDRF